MSFLKSIYKLNLHTGQQAHSKICILYILEEKSCLGYIARAKQFYFCVLGQVVYANHFINLTGENLTSTSLFEKHCGNLLSDLISLAINKYTKVTNFLYTGYGQLDAYTGNHMNWELHQCIDVFLVLSFKCYVWLCISMF